jgi:hypothetical protein
VTLISSVLAFVAVAECASICFLASAPYRVTPLVASVIRVCDVVVLASIPISCFIVFASLTGAPSLFRTTPPRERYILLILAVLLACLGFLWLLLVAPAPHSIRHA